MWSYIGASTGGRAPLARRKGVPEDVAQNFHVKFNSNIQPYLVNSSLSKAGISNKKKLNSVALVRKLTIPTERPPHVSKVSANSYGQRVSRGHRKRAATFAFK
jgi:hypothetical protein